MDARGTDNRKGDLGEYVCMILCIEAMAFNKRGDIMNVNLYHFVNRKM